MFVAVDGTTLEVKAVPGPGNHDYYGLALDKDGSPWMAGYGNYGALGFYRFDVATASVIKITSDSGGPLRGMMIDREGFGWAAGNTSLSV